MLSTPRPFFLKIIALIIISMFGPYIFPKFGLRLGQIVVYDLFLIYVILRLPFKFNTTIIHYSFIIMLMVALFLISGILNNYQNNTSLVIAQVENFIQPIIVLLLLDLVINKYRINEKHFHYVLNIFINLMAINTVFIAFTLLYPPSGRLLDYFSPLDLTQNYGLQSTLQKALGNGRFLGVFSQPVESGMAYGIALFSFFTVMDLSKDSFNLKSILILILLIIGGFFAISKIFFLSIAIILFFSIKDFTKVKLKSFILIFFGFLVIVFFFTEIKNVWGGLIYFFNYFSFSNKSVFNILLSGRLSKGSSILSNSREIYDSYLLFGRGFPIKGAVDNAYLEYFYDGGLIGLAFCLIQYLYIYKILILNQVKEYKLFFKMIFLLVIFGGMGAPVLGMNRVSIILTTIIFFAIKLQLSEKRQKLYT